MTFNTRFQRFQRFHGFHGFLGFGLVLAWFAAAAAQEPVTAIRAGRLFDARTGAMLTNQIVLIRGDRIADVGGNVAVPAGARVVDLSSATVLPGMIDAHVHVALNVPNESFEHHTFVMIQSAQRDLDAGFTTIVDMESRGGFGTVELRNAINSGLVRGPRMQVAGQSLNPRASAQTPNIAPGLFSGVTENKNINGPWLARAAVRELKLHGTDWAKIYTTQDFVGDELREFRPDASLVAIPSLTLEEVQAIVDEAHRLGLKVACHTYGGEGMRSCVEAGVDLPMHMLELYKRRCAAEGSRPQEAPGDDDDRRPDRSRRGRPEDDGRKDVAARDGRADVQEAAGGGRALAVRERRRARAISARQAGESVHLLREVGHDAGAGAADGVSHGRQRAELRLVGSGRQPGEGQVCGRDRRQRRSARRRQ
jgi:imidazolonepropionase-like amidohydrolase